MYNRGGTVLGWGLGRGAGGRVGCGVDGGCCVVLEVDPVNLADDVAELLGQFAGMGKAVILLDRLVPLLELGQAELAMVVQHPGDGRQITQLQFAFRLRHRFEDQQQPQLVGALLPEVGVVLVLPAGQLMDQVGVVADSLP